MSEYQQRRSGIRELDDWFSEGMVVALHETGVRPGAGQGYGYRVPPIIDGSLGRENIVVVELGGWQLFMTMLHRAVKQLPPGTRITRIEMHPDGTFAVHTENQ